MTFPLKLRARIAQRPQVFWDSLYLLTADGELKSLVLSRDHPCTLKYIEVEGGVYKFHGNLTSQLQYG